MTATYEYDAHGLRISTEVALPGLPEATARRAADVTIRYGLAPARLGPDAAETPQFACDAETVLFAESWFGRVAVQGGATITVEPAADVSPGDVSAFAGARGVGAILNQRRRAPLHGACVAKDGVAVALLGESGAGKSTTAAGLVARGWRVLTDDLVTLDWSDGAPMVEPGARAVRLWEDASALIPQTDAAPAGGGAAKRMTPPDPDVAPARLIGVVSLSWLVPGDAAAEVTPVPTLQALPILRRNIFLSTLARHLGLDGAYLTMLTRLLSVAPLTLCARPRRTGSLAAVCDMIEDLKEGRAC